MTRDRHERGRRAVHPPPRRPPPREGPRRDLRGRDRQPVLHDRHRGGAARGRDRRRGPPQGDEGRRRLRRGSDDEPDARDATLSCSTRTCSETSSRCWTRRPSRCAWRTSCRSSSSTSNQPDNITRVAVGEPVGTLDLGARAPSEVPRMSTETQASAEHKMARAVEAHGARLPGRSGPAAPRPRSSSASTSTTTAPQTPLNQLAGDQRPRGRTRS